MKNIFVIITYFYIHILSKVFKIKHEIQTTLLFMQINVYILKNLVQLKKIFLVKIYYILDSNIYPNSFLSQLDKVVFCKIKSSAKHFILYFNRLNLLNATKSHYFFNLVNSGICLSFLGIFGTRNLPGFQDCKLHPQFSVLQLGFMSE